jgi:anthranilate phosphoribosyltransferase
LVARSGAPVLLHGWNSHQQGRASVRDALGYLDIPSAGSVAEAGPLLESHGIAYLPLEVLSPRLMHLLRLRDKFGLRSCVNTVLRMLNPGAAPAAVQGVFHPSYRELQADAARLLGDARLSVLKGGGGEFEHHPAKDIAVYGLRDGQSWSGFTGRSLTQHRRLAEDDLTSAALSALWTGELEDAFAQATVLGTAALALDAAGVTRNAAEMAETLWAERGK